MNRLVYWGTMMLLLLFIGCKPDTDNLCRIHGEMADHSRDGKKIYLVPMYRPDSVGVDSTVITDGKFEFTTDKHLMAIVRVEMRSRYGMQDLLVVTEAGDVSVRIDSVSSSSGTPQNDSLQQWKNHTESLNQRMRLYRNSWKDAQTAGDTVSANAIQTTMESLRRSYRRYSRNMAEGLKEGVLHDFLKQQFPTSYKRKMPDGTIKEIQID